MRLRRPVVIVYTVGLFQGLALVAIPAAATILQSPSGYDLSSTQYGLLFLPQVVMAIAGAPLGLRFRRRPGCGSLLRHQVGRGEGESHSPPLL